MLMKKLTANSFADFKTKFAATLLLTSFLSACATAPGNYLDTSRLKEDGQNHPTETYPVHLIDGSLIAEVEGSKVRLSANADVAVTMEQEA